MKKGNRIIAAVLALAPAAAYAGEGWSSPERPTNAPEDFESTVVNATNWILGFVALIAVLMIIWGGVQYLTSAGNQDQVRTGKDTIKYALMGLVVAGIAYALVNLIVTDLLQ